MIELEKVFESNKYEDKIYKRWLKSEAFKSNINKGKEPFVISMPPPNATGELHMGHGLTYTLQDIMIRKKRMEGFETLWLPGTDHAAIATQSVVEKKLQKEGIKDPRKELGREKLLEEIKKFVENSKNKMKSQLQMLGSSCDWDREKYTLDDDLNHSVNTFFERLYNDGLIYQGDRIVNWDPNMKTTVSDDEVEYKQEKSKFYYFKYGPVVIGTARPETKFLDKIIVVNPKDKRYKDIIGKEFELEWINGPIKAKVIADDSVDIDMGTGAMTITPAHSMIDFELAEKYNLEKPQIIDFDGKLLDIAEEFSGMHISEAREKIVEKLKNKGLLVKIDENYVHDIAVNARGKGIIEPQIMKQWFVDVNKKKIDWKGEKRSMKEVMQDVIRSKMIEIIPKKIEKIYFNYVDNLRDWCISRQIWWGHQIPIWYKLSEEDKSKWDKYKEPSSYMISVLNITPIEIVCSDIKPEGGNWIRDPDTLDTWFSSALWTFSTLGWPNHTEELKYYHPTDVLQTGRDLIFFWIAKMILASTYALKSDGLSETQSIPFKKVVLNGLIQDINGKKMSKSNPKTCIDPIDVIERYGADAVRLSVVVGNSMGNDMRLYEAKIAGFRNFINKLWNASRFVLLNVESEDLDVKDIKNYIISEIDTWILYNLEELIREVNEEFEKFRFSDALDKIYKFTWGQYCDWYLEFSKGEFKNIKVAVYVLKEILKLLHPFTPFVTEEIWSHIDKNTMLIKTSWSINKKEFIKDNNITELIIQIVTAIRSVKSDLNIKEIDKIEVVLNTKGDKGLKKYRNEIKRLAKIKNIEIITSGEMVEKAIIKNIEGMELNIIIKGGINIDEEINKLKIELEKNEDQLKKIKIKLKNKGFILKAPKSVIENEKHLEKKLKEEIEIIKTKMEELKSYISKL